MRLENLEDRRVLDAVGVTTLADVVDSPNMTSIAALQNNRGADGKISLREAITAANADAVADTITFDASVSGMNGGQILLSLARGQLNITNALTIDASGLSAGITINGNDPTPGPTAQGIRIFNITDSSAGVSVVTFVGLKMIGADTVQEGGAIRSESRLIVRDCVIQENEAQTGGGIFVQVAGGGASPREVLRIENSTIDSNFAFSGGGLAWFSGNSGSPTQDTAVIVGTTFRYQELNTFNTAGGAIDATLFGATLTIDEGTFLLNEAQDGGAIHAILSEGAELNIVNSSFQENDASADGGGVHAVVTDSTVEISGGTTFVDNLATESGGGVWLDLFGTATANISDSSFTQNKALQVGGGLFLRTAESEHHTAGQPLNTVLSVQDSLFDGNEATEGGGLALALGGAAFDGQHFQAVGQRAAITRSTISANKAVSNGGGIRTWQGAGAEVEVVESTISGNTAGLLRLNNPSYSVLADSGGGVYSYLFSGDDPVLGGDPNDTDNGMAKLVISGTTVNGNQAGNLGGGIAICAKRQDADLAIRSRLAVVNSTISGNSVLGDDPTTPYIVEPDGKGGGVAVAIYPSDEDEGMDAHFQNATVTKNRAEIGGGIWSMVPDRADGRMNTWLTNTIIAGNTKLDNTTGDNFNGSIVATSTQFNLFGPAATNSLFSNVNHASLTFGQLGAGNLQAANNDPKLSALASYGGPTRTHQLLADSPAIDHGSTALAKVPFTSTDLTTDQRGAGFPRPFDITSVSDGTAGFVDIGAYEAGRVVICVSTTTDEFDQDLTDGDLSLREAVNYANTAWETTTICLPTGVYHLTISGTGGVSQGDLDVTGNVTIVGDGPGLSIIDAGGFSPHDRIFDVAAGGALDLSYVTLTLGYAPGGSGGQRDGGALRVQNNGELNLSYSAVVANLTAQSGDGGGIYFAPTGRGSLDSSVITYNEADDTTGGVHLASATGAGGVVTIKNTIVAKNTASNGTGVDVFAGTNRSFTSLGNNRVGNATAGLYDDPTGNGDMVGTPDYIVTTVVDTYDGSSDPINMSLRDAIHQANITAGTQEIWLPAWTFVLTRERTTAWNLPELDVWEGDIEITDSLILRGIGGASGPATNVAWMDGAAADKVFELVGDYDNDIENDIDCDVDGDDFLLWQQIVANGGSDLSADGNDNGVVDNDDLNTWLQRVGNTLSVDSIAYL